MPNITLREILDILYDSRNKVFNYMIDVVYEINGYEPEPGSITVCNYHKSKGMEWDQVFLLQLNKFHFPDNISVSFALVIPTYRSLIFSFITSIFVFV